MKKKGFTLIELLAVIVVLAIIALIAVPMVLNTIEEAKKGAVKETVNSYVSATETSVMSKMIQDNTVNFNNVTCSLSGKNMTCTNSTLLEINVKGDTLDSLNVTFGEEGVIETGTFKKNNYCGNYIKNKGVKFTECGAEEVVDASEVSFTPSDENWEVTTVEEALNDLYSR